MRNTLREINCLQGEWYHPDLRGIIVYFDSWEDLQKKVAALDYETIHEKTLAYGKAQTQEDDKTLAKSL